MLSGPRVGKVGNRSRCLSSFKTTLNVLQTNAVPIPTRWSSRCIEPLYDHRGGVYKTPPFLRRCSALGWAHVLPEVVQVFSETV
jgi:hypothetical protein